MKCHRCSSASGYGGRWHASWCGLHLLPPQRSATMSSPPEPLSIDLHEYVSIYSRMASTCSNLVTFSTEFSYLNLDILRPHICSGESLCFRFWSRPQIYLFWPYLCYKLNTCFEPRRTVPPTYPFPYTTISNTVDYDGGCFVLSCKYTCIPPLPLACTKI